jgi:uncharacterized membrane protein
MEEPQPSAVIAGRIHLLATIPVAAAFCLFLGQMMFNPGPAAKFEWQLPWLIALAALSTLTALARQLQWQYVLTAASICALWGAVAHGFSANTGLPFGPFTYGPDAGPQFFNQVPWTVPVLWLVVLFNSRGVGRLILRPWRKLKSYGFWLIGCTVVLSGLFDLGMDPFLSRWQHYWLWAPTKLRVTWAGAPLTNFLGWMFVTLLILAFATPVLIKKQPGSRSPSDYHPLVLWVGGMVLFAVVAGRQGLWPAVGLDVVAVAVATVAAVRGGRW